MKIKLLDRYILLQFLGAFFFVVLALDAIIVVINITERNDDFIEHGLTVSQILPYYRDFIPYVTNMITPITVFIATVFVTSRLAGRSEIIAILSSGVSFRRLMIPYLVGATFIAVLSFFLNAYIIPNSNKTRVEFEIKYTKNPYYYNDRDVHIRIGENKYFYMQSYNNRINTAFRVTLEDIDEETGELKARLYARKMVWQEDSVSARWIIEEWMLRKLVGNEEIITSGDKIDTTFNILPKDFENQHNLFETMTVSELNAQIKEFRERGIGKVEPYIIEKYNKYMAPFAVLILTAIGLIVSSRKVRGGVGLQIAMGFLIAFIYIIFFTMSKAIAENGSMNIMLALWLPNIIFSIVAVFLYKNVPR